MRARRLLPLVLAALPALGWCQAMLEPSAAVACLRHLQPGSAPEYPFDAFKQQHAGEVAVELAFAGPDDAPRVKVLSSSSDKADVASFEQAVKAHVHGLRLPCARAGEAPVRLVQTYSFEPDRREAIWHQTQDPLDDQRHRQLQCITHTSGSLKPDYPAHARRSNIQGNVVAHFRFEAPDQPPQAEVFARRNAAALRKAIENWVAGLRLPCHEGGQVRATWTFAFQLAGDTYGFKPLTLPELMGLVRDIRKQTLSFDTTRMNCPFDLRFTYRRPFLPNRLAEVVPGPGDRASTLAVPMPPRVPDPKRRELLQWLEGVELVAPDASLDAIFGDTALVSVPCVKIDLKPKE